MAQSDINLMFVQSAAPQTITATAPSAYYLDLATGTAIATGGAYTASSALPLVWGANATNLYFGEDLGIGPEKLPLAIYSGSAAFATLTSLNIQFQGAVDNGGTTYGGLTWATYSESGTIVTALLTANAALWKEYFPHRKIAAAGTNGSLPRFLQLNFVVAGSNATTGSINFAGFLETRDDNPTGNYGGGFTVGP
jgi:hypothetical protein